MRGPPAQPCGSTDTLVSAGTCFASITSSKPTTAKSAPGSSLRLRSASHAPKATASLKQSAAVGGRRGKQRALERGNAAAAGWRRHRRQSMSSGVDAQLGAGLAKAAQPLVIDAHVGKAAEEGDPAMALRMRCRWPAPAPR